MEDYSCTCEDGFYGDGFSCIDFDECKESFIVYATVITEIKADNVFCSKVGNIWMWNQTNLF